MMAQATGNLILLQTITQPAAALPVSSAVTFLLVITESGKPSALPQTTKAIVMAGAQNEFPEWSRSHEKPIDSVLGVGKINVFNSYKIITESEKSLTTSITIMDGFLLLEKEMHHG